MKMIKVWIVPKGVLIADFLKDTPPTYIFPLLRYGECKNTIFGTDGLPDGGWDWWAAHHEGYVEMIKACQNLALRLEIEKEVDNSEELGDN